ncbi:MAG: hypothetical protein H0V17_26625 [Deltaproteobacteria bacterium]|nr:hypothetical protein [Deltaproteobacteria bacterium]
MSRERRELVPYEIAIVVAIAVLPLPDVLPVALPLVIVATISRSMRGRTWNEVSTGSASRMLVGMLAGAIALGVALLAGSQSLTALFAQSGERIITMSEFATATEQPSLIVLSVVAVAITAFALELALRGWIVERVLELSPGAPVLPVLVGAVAEALVTPGDIPTRIAAGLFGAGLGWLYVAGGRSIVTPVCARMMFQCGAVTLQALRLV